ncbi:hypothetical protein BP6252_09233 [Coleophoma cylindrospora]|uniref:Mid2 domain-containing protein n=1 Tax=Coleophoma cylindrospora TaxID=1849047 RepID=A0A3D8R1C8_9HELO|nr:hypothetical protein BP6252_09233 [Coleophoma cylindrospora]
MVYAEGDGGVQVMIDRAAASTVIVERQKGNPYVDQHSSEASAATSASSASQSSVPSASQTSASGSSSTPVTVTWFDFPTLSLDSPFELKWQIEPVSPGTTVPKLDLVLAQTGSTGTVDSANSWVVLELSDPTLICGPNSSSSPVCTESENAIQQAVEVLLSQNQFDLSALNNFFFCFSATGSATCEPNTYSIVFTIAGGSGQGSSSSGTVASVTLQTTATLTISSTNSVLTPSTATITDTIQVTTATASSLATTAVSSTASSSTTGSSSTASTTNTSPASVSVSSNAPSVSPTASTPGNSKTTGLSTGAKAGIAIGIILGILLALICLYLALRHRKRQSRSGGEHQMLTSNSHLGQSGSQDIVAEKGGIALGVTTETRDIGDERPSPGGFDDWDDDDTSSAEIGIGRAMPIYPQRQTSVRTYEEPYHDRPSTGTSSPILSRMHSRPSTGVIYGDARHTPKMHNTSNGGGGTALSRGGSVLSGGGHSHDRSEGDGSEEDDAARRQIFAEEGLDALEWARLQEEERMIDDAIAEAETRRKTIYNQGRRSVDF